MQKVYIRNTSKFLPGKAIDNEKMEEYLGRINGHPSRSKRIILRQNKITERYYAIDKEGNLVYDNAEMTAQAIQSLENKDLSLQQVELLACGTSIPDQLLPSHASMVHGRLGISPVEIFSPAGVCSAGMHALKIAYMSVMTGNSTNAVSSGSELISPLLRKEKYAKEALNLSKLTENPILGFEKDFLRWMLSDGAGALWIDNKPNDNELSLRIDWIETISFASELQTCMYAGAEKKENGKLKSWKEMEQEEWLEKSVFAVKQDVKLLGEYIVPKGIKKLAEILNNKNVNSDQIDYFLPHLSSMYFKEKVYDEMLQNNVEIPLKKWFTNLPEVGNIGSASIYLMLNDLFHSGKLRKGEKIVVLVPESGRFSYAYMHLTVC